MTENEQSLLLYETALARAQLAVEVQGQTHAIKEAEHATKLAEAMQSIGTMQVAMEAQYQSHSARLNCGGMPARRTRRASDSRIPQQRLAAATTPSPCVKDRIGSSDDPWTNRARVKDDYTVQLFDIGEWSTDEHEAAKPSELVGEDTPPSAQQASDPVGHDDVRTHGAVGLAEWVGRVGVGAGAGAERCFLDEGFESVWQIVEAKVRALNKLACAWMQLPATAAYRNTEMSECVPYDTGMSVHWY